MLYSRRARCALSFLFCAYAKLRMENAKSPRSFSILNSQLLHPCVNPAIPGKINAVMKMKLQTPAVFALGAAGYAALELLWRGRTHWTMALTGGAVLVGLRQLRRRVHEENPLSRCLCGAACITAAEYVVGCTVNRHFRLRVWDYSHEFGNVQGQICPKYAALWALLAAPIMLPK